MLLVIVIVLLLIGSAVVGSIYSGFLVFYNNFSEVENYNKAYYAAVWALERAELVVKQRWAWFEWSGWWIESVWTGMLANGWSDWPIDSFSYLSSTDSQKSSLFWTITSRTSRIPKEWEWDVDWTLLSWDADYNVMGYEYAENFLLYYDNGGGWSPYSSNFLYTKSPVSSITWVIRLPEKLKSAFWKLDDKDDNTKLFWRVANDAIVDWQLRGNYQNKPFTIYATQDIHQQWTKYVIDKKDSAIRESDINNDAALSFSTKKTPLSRYSTTAEFTIISPLEAEIKNSTSRWFQSIFNGDDFKNLKLRLALLNLLKTKIWIYPYLEYYMQFSEPISDKYFTINAEWKYGDYQVNLVVKKPTFKESILWSFTVVF